MTDLLKLRDVTDSNEQPQAWDKDKVPPASAGRSSARVASNLDLQR